MNLDETVQTDTVPDLDRFPKDMSMAEKPNGKTHTPEAEKLPQDGASHAEAAADEKPKAATETDPPRAPPNLDTAFGQAVWLMMNTPQFKHTFLADLEWMILPPILLGQYRIFYAEGRLVGFAAWAYVSDEVKVRLESSNPRLTPAEWKSGNNVVLTELFTPFGGQERVREELKKSIFKQKGFEMHLKKSAS